MALVRSKDTRPEMVVRRLAHSLGFRFRLHNRNLPGSPDLVFVAQRCVIFIHGCFWHQHSCASGDRIPKSRIGFWRDKLNGNVDRDRRALRKLRSLRWRVLVVWECQLKQLDRLAERIRRFLEDQRRTNAGLQTKVARPPPVKRDLRRANQAFRRVGESLESSRVRSGQRRPSHPVSNGVLPKTPCPASDEADEDRFHAGPIQPSQAGSK